MSKLSWSEFKTLCNSKALNIQSTNGASAYYLQAWDGPILIRSSILISDPANDDQIDYETNYQANANKKISISTDSENAPIQRSKTAPTGWTYHAHSFEFTTSKLDAIFNSKPDLTPYNFCTAKFYNVSNVELTDQPTIDTDCVKTVLDFEPTHDYEVISGRIYVKNHITNEDVRLWCVAVPDVPEAYGGSKIMVSGINLDFLDEYQPIITDGRVSKRLNYSATLHTNKLRFIISHPAGKQVPLMILMEMYKV